jgi:hypothetical protein
METTKIIYWASTALVCLAMIFSSYSDLRSKEVKAAFVRFGFPAYFRVELGIMKIIGILLLVAPLPPFCKEWAYAGFAITFFSAFIAHSVAKDAAKDRIAPLVILTFLLVSDFTFHYL